MNIFNSIVDLTVGIIKLSGKVITELPNTTLKILNKMNEELEAINSNGSSAAAGDEGTPSSHRTPSAQSSIREGVKKGGRNTAPTKKPPHTAHASNFITPDPDPIPPPKKIIIEGYQPGPDFNINTASRFNINHNRRTNIGGYQPTTSKLDPNNPPRNTNG